MTKDEMLLNTMRCTITEDAEDENENYYFKWNDVSEVMQQFSDQENKAMIEEVAQLRKRIEELEGGIHLLLDHVDHTEGACAINEMVGACLPKQVIENVKKLIINP